METKLGTFRILNIGKEKSILSKRTTEAEVIEYDTYNNKFLKVGNSQKDCLTLGS